MFHIINSLSLTEYVIILIAATILCVVGLCTMKKSEKKWWWVYCYCIILYGYLITQRVVSEYMPGTKLDEICQMLMYVSVLSIIIVVGIIAYLSHRNKK